MYKLIFDDLWSDTFLLLQTQKGITHIGTLWERVEGKDMKMVVT